MFIFRNNTIEQLFGGGYQFSGYGDISVIPEADGYVWCYQVPLTGANAAEVVASYLPQLQMLLQRLDMQKPVLVFTLHPLFELRYSETDFALREAVSAFNMGVFTLAREYKNVRVIDFTAFCAGHSAEQLINWKYYFISQAVINPCLAGDFRKWFARKLEEIAFKRKKCLVLDLDNTLWGGILGEDGIDGIRIGGDYPGKAFRYFQEAIFELSQQGIILAICSKNNESDVMDCLENNPHLILRKEHFSAWRINWNNKADNIRELATELNIGLDSLVFVDDNPAERELVRQQLPEVVVPDFPEQPYMLLPFFKKLVSMYFGSYALTDEDRAKTEQYKANVQRCQAVSMFTDLKDYLKSLEMILKVREADVYSIPRVAQMTQKTNQFNLTTPRYTEADIESLLISDARVFTLSVRDKFGDNGITGVMIVKLVDTRWHIDTLLLSCRVLGKGIEQAFVKYVLNTLLSTGLTDVLSVEAEYIPTKKNAQVADFYNKIGLIEQEEKEGVKHYTLQMNTLFEIENYYTFE